MFFLFSLILLLLNGRVRIVQEKTMVGAGLGDSGEQREQEMIQLNPNRGKFPSYSHKEATEAGGEMSV